MSLLGNRAAADFARLVDAGATAGPGLALVAQLRTAGAALDVSVGPRPEFRDALRKRLLAVATVSGAAAASSPARALPAAVSWRRRGSTVAAGALASVVAVSGVAVAGSQSLPGDPFYGVKRTTEALQLQLADGEVEKGTRHLDFAATRLREVRGLTLGRDATDSGPALGPAAIAGISLRSGDQPLADGEALGADVAERVRRTLADMDEQTREGTELLTEAYRSTQATEPLQALSRFATRQSAGLEQLLPVLPEATQPRARQSLALLTDVEETTDELLAIGTCGTSCDPSTAAPTVPVAPGTPAPTPVESGDCECPDPVPAPDPRPTTDPTPEPGATSDPEPTPTRTPEPQPTSPTPSPTPSQDPLPLPSLPVPVPSLPVPVPTLTLLPEPVASVLDPLLAVSGKASSSNASSGGSAPAPAPAPQPAPTPVPQLAPLPPRP